MPKLHLEMVAQGIKASVRTLVGRVQENFLKEMKRATTSVENGNDRMRALALETPQGSAADF